MRLRWPWARDDEPKVLLSAEPKVLLSAEPKVLLSAEPVRGDRRRREIGATGTTYFSGIIADEYNRDLAGAAGIEVYDRMRRSDAQVQAVLWICELPIRSATWSVEPASASAADVEIAQIVQDNLLENMTITWDDFLRQALLMLPFGHMVFEKVWQRRDGLVVLRKLAPRLPASIAKWDIDGNGGLRGIEQMVWTGSGYERPYIPIEKLLVFTYRKEGANWAGQSLLRAAYKHWYYKDNFYRIDAIGNERHGVGVPYVKMSDAASEADYEEAAEILQALHAHERTYVVGKHCWEEFTMVGIDRATQSVVSTLPSVEHHDLMIARSILAQFLNLGADRAGSYALSKDQSTFFLMALRALANQITDVVNEYAIKPMVDFNWSVADYPKLTYTKLEQRDLASYGDAIAKLVRGGAIVTDESLRDALRDLFGLPEEPEGVNVGPAATAAAQPERQTPAAPPDDDEDHGTEPAALCDCGGHHVAKLTDTGFWRELRAGEDEQALLSIRDIVAQGRDNYVAAAQAVAARQRDRLVELALPAIEAKDAAKLTNLSAPYKAELAQAMTGVLQAVYLRGHESVDLERWRKTELPRLGVPESLALVDPALLAADFLIAKAKSAAQILSIRLLAALTWEALDQVKQGRADEGALRSVMEQLSERNLTDMANTSVPEALNLGRRDATAAIEDEIDRAQYSAILDERVCFAPGTLMLSETGWVTVESVKQGDRFLTGDGVYAPVVAVMQRQARGAVAIHAGGRRLLVTPDHPVLVERNGRVAWLEAGIIRVGDKVFTSEPREPLVKAAADDDAFGQALKSEPSRGSAGILASVGELCSGQAVPATAVNLNQYPECGQKEVEGVTPNAILHNNLQAELFKCLAGGPLGLGLADSASVAGEGAEAPTSACRGGDTELVATGLTGEHHGRAPAFFRAMPTVGITGSLEVFATPLTELPDGACLCTGAGAYGVPGSIGDGYGELPAALGADFGHAVHSAFRGAEPTRTATGGLVGELSAAASADERGVLALSPLVAGSTRVATLADAAAGFDLSCDTAVGTSNLHEYIIPHNVQHRWIQCVVSAVEPVDYTGTVYDVSLANRHTFFAEGMLVHNCGACRNLDGLEVTLDDPRYEQYMPPNPECLGGDRCRCVWVLIFKAEGRAVR